MMDVNRRTIPPFILPEQIENSESWESAETEIYIDFETMANIFDNMQNIPLQTKTDMIFLIGAYVKTPTEKYFKHFSANDTTMSAEYEIMKQFADFLNSFDEKKVYYWHAESNFWKRHVRCNTLVPKGFRLDSDYWYDLAQMFRNEGITIKDCFSYGLKDLASSLHKLGFIESSLSGGIKNGLDVMIRAKSAYNSDDKAYREQILDEIVKYNLFDCKVLHEIISYFRERCTD